MHRALLLLSSLFLMAAAASAQPDTARKLVTDGDFGPATLVIEYQDGTDLLRRARLTLAPASEEANPIPRDAIDQIGVLSKGGQWIIIDGLLSYGHSTGIQAEAMLPAPESILIIMIKPERGPWRSWRVQEGALFAEIEWTYFNQRGRQVRSAPCSARECFGNVTDEAFNQAESTASSFRMDIRGFSFGVERE